MDQPNSPTSWLVNLHEAIATGKDGTFADIEEGIDTKQFSQLRFCLTQLEELRRELLSETSPGESISNVLGLCTPDSTPAINGHQNWLLHPLIDHSPGPRQLGRFEIIRELGRGGHGVVF